MGDITAPLPVFKSIKGDLSKLSMSEDPYPTPLLDKCIDVTDPLIIGLRTASKVFPSMEDIPILPSMVTAIS